MLLLLLMLLLLGDDGYECLLAALLYGNMDYMTSFTGSYGLLLLFTGLLLTSMAMYGLVFFFFFGFSSFLCCGILSADDVCCQYLNSKCFNRNITLYYIP